MRSISADAAARPSRSPATPRPPILACHLSPHHTRFAAFAETGSGRRAAALFVYRRLGGAKATGADADLNTEGRLDVEGRLDQSCAAADSASKASKSNWLRSGRI